jgi:uncharacterized protein YaaR (DUF327 family)
MKINATTLRTLVMDNSFDLGRLTAEQLGSIDDYKELTSLYTTALDALTEWAGKCYNHTSVKEDADGCFNAIKAILALYTTDDDRIIIDQQSMSTMRDCATKPKRIYSKEYNMAEKARRYAEKVVKERMADLVTMGAPERNDGETLEAYTQRVRESGVKTVVKEYQPEVTMSVEDMVVASMTDVALEGKSFAEALADTHRKTQAHTIRIDMLDMYINASAFLSVKTQAVENIKAKGKYVWKRPVPVALSEFADLIENYIADCLNSGYNMKSSKTVREEKKYERAEDKLLKEKIEAEING